MLTDAPLRTTAEGNYSHVCGKIRTQARGLTETSLRYSYEEQIMARGELMDRGDGLLYYYLLRVYSSLMQYLMTVPFPQLLHNIAFNSTQIHCRGYQHENHCPCVCRLLAHSALLAASSLEL